ncbi:hypothetical protein CRENBAI_021207 [Crenichthys baileyi]|uniref:Uncharacterized protein n=1 Tax=Crenichthys baileyi TaxID=28760 RepID=A0AAV9REX1_9TELE
MRGERGEEDRWGRDPEEAPLLRLPPSPSRPPPVIAGSHRKGPLRENLSSSQLLLLFERSGLLLLLLSMRGQKVSFVLPRYLLPEAAPNLLKTSWSGGRIPTL